MISKKEFIFISLIVYLLVSFNHNYTKGIINPNERIRFFLTHAITTRGELNVNTELKQYGTTIDRATYKGDNYCDKAPMQSFLAVPHYFIAQLIFGKKIPEKLSLLIIKLFQHYLLAVLLFWLLYLFLFKYSNDKKLSLLTAGGALFATPLYSFFILVFSHSITATFLFMFYLLSLKMRDRETTWYISVAAGLLGGITVMTEYTSVGVLTVITAFTFFRMKNKLRFLQFLAGGAIMAALFFLYNTVIFGGPLSLGYGNLASEHFAKAQSVGLWGITFPKPQALFDTLISFRMGVFTLSPFLLTALYGMYRGLKTKDLQIIETVSLVLVHLYLVTSFSVWDGGGTFGSRHLVPVLPFIVFLSFYGLLYLKKIIPSAETFYRVTMISSFFIFSFTLMIFPYFAVKFKNPVATFALPTFREQFFPNSSLLTLVGLSKTASFWWWMIIILTVAVMFIYKLYGKKNWQKISSTLLLAMSFTFLYFIPYKTDPVQLEDTYKTIHKMNFHPKWRVKRFMYDGQYGKVFHNMEKVQPNFP